MVLSVENSNNNLPLTLAFIGVILLTLSVILAGYFHGDMHLLTTLKNAKEFYD